MAMPITVRLLQRGPLYAKRAGLSLGQVEVGLPPRAAAGRTRAGRHREAAGLASGVTNRHDEPFVEM